MSSSRIGLTALRQPLLALRAQSRLYSTTPKPAPPKPHLNATAPPTSSYNRIRSIIASNSSPPAPVTASSPTASPAARPQATTFLSSLRPPPGSPLHTLLFSTKLHNTLTFISLIILLFACQAINFLSSDPYAAIVRWSWWDPIGSVHRWWTAARMSVIDGSKKVGEMRRIRREEKENVEAYLRAHGLMEPLPTVEAEGESTS